LLRTALVAGAAAAAVIIGTTGGATAATLDASGDGSGEACAVAADAASAPVCFDDVAETIAYITGAPVTDSSAQRGDRAALETVITAHNQRVATAQRAGAAQLSGPGTGAKVDLRAAASAASPASVPASTAAAAETSALAATPAAAEYSDIVLGAEWSDKSWKGKVAVLYASTGTGCGYGSTYGFPHTRDFGMNDNITSLSGYSQCATTIYKNSSYGGTSKTFQTETSYVGSTMNDQTSSIVFRPRS
jgi:hypothetical protein